MRNPLIGHDCMDEVEKWNDMDAEQLSGDNCPFCGYPLVIESGIEVCYNCGASQDLFDELKKEENERT